MATFRLTFTDTALDEKNNESLVFHDFIDVVADRYDNPRGGKHDFYEANGDLKCSYRDASITVDRLDQA